MTFDQYFNVKSHRCIHVIGKVAADSLAALSGSEGTGHLSHMPAHTYNRIGSYDSCIRSSVRAVNIDEYYTYQCLKPYMPLHNRGLLVSCAMSSGHYMDAINYSFTIRDTNEGVSIFLTGKRVSV